MLRHVLLILPLAMAFAFAPQSVVRAHFDDIRDPHDDQLEPVITAEPADRVEPQEPARAESLFGNRVIFLGVSLVLIVLLTWGVLKIVNVKPPAPPPGG